MRYQVLRVRLSPDKTVRMLLTAVMGFVLAFMLLLNSQQVAAQDPDQMPYGEELYGQEPYGLSRDEVVAQLGDRYQEAPVAGGIATNGNILEVFVSPDGLSLTIIVTRPDGMSSVVAEGEGWSFTTAVEGLPV